jgi:NADPH-dependent ferric siderophore reductase
MTVQTAPTDTAAIPAYRPFSVQVVAARRLSPGFVRLTFSGADLDEFASNGFDQRIKVVLPLAGRGLRDFPHTPDWYSAWRQLPADRRNPVRTYTVRAARPLERQVDVDFVVHDGAGPAGAWAEAARPGDDAVLVGPNAGFPGPTGGFEWRPPAGATELLLAGDETAVPAIAAILEALPAGTRAHALLEVPSDADVLDLDLPAGVRATWLPRRCAAAGTRPRGALLTDAVLAAAARFGGPATGDAPNTVDDDLLWEVPAEDAGTPGGRYAWLAGEAGMVTTLRRRLLGDHGLDRGCVAFMGYWRAGRVLD